MSISATTTAPEKDFLFKQCEPLPPIKANGHLIVVKLDDNSVKATSACDSLKILHFKFVGEGENSPSPYRSLRIPDNLSLTDAVNLARIIPGIKIAEPNYMCRAAMVPDDPYCVNDPNPANNYYPDQWYSFRVNAVSRGSSAFNIQTGSPQILIAVLDTGVDMDNPDLYDRVVPGYDFVGQDPGVPGDNDYPGDPNPDVYYPDASVGNGIDDDGDGIADGGVSHGTIVAGVIASKMGNQDRFCGLAPGCRILVVRVLNPEGGGYVSDVADGIYLAANQGATVINLSLGIPKQGLTQLESQILQDACDYARSKGSLVVAASGNDGGPVLYPAAFPGVIAVGSTSPASTRSSFSNYGPQLALAAPGEDIWSLYVVSYADYLSQYGAPGSADLISESDGTSLACPIVSALAGLLASQALPNTLSPDELESQLLAAGKDYPARSDQLGYGEVNYMRAINPLRQPAPVTLSLGAPYPNPFKPGGFGQQELSIPLGLANDGNVKIQVYDLAGHLVKVVWDGWMTANTRVLAWDGRDGANQYAAKGVYIIKAEAAGMISSRNILLIR
jgi:thermitase